MAENSQDLPKCRRKQAHSLGEVAASWLSCSQSSMGTAFMWQSCCPPPSPAPQFSFNQSAPCKVQLEDRSSQQSVPAWELPPRTGASVRSAAVCSEVIYLHGPISCKYWQHLGGGLQTLRAATLISAPFHLKASVQQAQKTGAG